ncbi:MAG: aminotransferase class I/II-fold pyridoxal phosphate-dependent enzyme [Flavobacteriales bacterium]|jgi:O-succinylhomoserine sulfhydrylase|nr:aminotransferase class I/II-fold pyridoxal phosphate-dependent enzyme [Flavobacteriales bacterium]
MSSKNFETQAIRTQTSKTSYKEHATPLFLTSSFTFDSAQEGEALFNGQADGHIYSRFSNPNVDEFVNKMCLLEQTESGVATATGMAAVFTTFAALLKSGDHIVASKAIFGNSLHILQSILPNYGISHTLVEIDDKEAWQKAVTPQTKLLFVESPSNPTLKIADLSFLGKLSKAHNLIFCIDNCFATPYLQQPVKFGANIIIHSATKYIDGQGRVLGGAILGDKKYVDLCYDFIRRTGASLSPFNAWVLSKSLETLAIRMDRHCENAEALYQFLAQHSDVEKIFYPFDKKSPQYDLAKKQQKLGGGLVGCQIKGGKERGTRFLNALKLHSLTANLGDTRSIATHPASTTHSKLSEAEQLDLGITAGFIRFSVGLEHIDDIIADVAQALENSK